MCGSAAPHGSCGILRDGLTRGSFAATASPSTIGVTIFRTASTGFRRFIREAPWIARRTLASGRTGEARAGGRFGGRFAAFATVEIIRFFTGAQLRVRLR
jgi:hypothetical protein